jgi:hypothetical protein
VSSLAYGYLYLLDRARLPDYSFDGVLGYLYVPAVNYVI